MKQDQEDWRPVVDAKDYDVSNHGQVRRKDTGRILSQARMGEDGDDYAAVCVERRGHKSNLAAVHWLVAEAFLGPRPKGHYIAFKDDDKENARADNLEYITTKEHRRRSSGKQFRRAAAEIASKLDRRSLALLDALVPAIAKLAATWPDFSVTRARCGHLPGFADLVDKKLARYDLTTLVRYCLHLERSGESWTGLSSPPSAKLRA